MGSTTCSPRIEYLPHSQVRFTVADGPSGDRSIWALVTENGLLREAKPVALYTVGAVASIQVNVLRLGTRAQ